MKALEAQRRLADITASQWGMVTARQAEAVGVGHLELSRLARGGHLERLEHGIYRDSGAPADHLEYLRAAWLSTEPDHLAGDRLRDRENGVVISGRSAATVHRIGDLREGAHEFTSPDRRQTRRPDIRYRKRILPHDAVVVRDGLPVVTPEQTILDLINDGEDLTLIAQAVRDATNDRLDQDAIASRLTATDARRYGIKSAADLWENILQNAHLDDRSLADEVAAGPIGSLVAEIYLRQLQQTIAKYPAEEVRKLTENILPDSAKTAIQSVLAEAASPRLPALPALEIVRAKLAASEHPDNTAVSRNIARAIGAGRIGGSPTAARKADDADES